jgi:hypothetical protein
MLNSYTYRFRKENAILTLNSIIFQVQMLDRKFEIEYPK